MDPLVKRMRDYLPALRLTAGWSAEYLAQVLDTSRSTIVNLENKARPMTKIQYMAIMYCLENAAKNDSMLKMAMDIVFGESPLCVASRKDLVKNVDKAKKEVGRKRGCKAIVDKIRETITA